MEKGGGSGGDLVGDEEGVKGLPPRGTDEHSRMNAVCLDPSCSCHNQRRGENSEGMMGMVLPYHDEHPDRHCDHHNVMMIG